jgi:spore germination cell wall hydrolase CwlJ-like protein
MLALRNRLVVAFSGPFWLSALCVGLAPTTIGYHDPAALLARQPDTAERWRDLTTSPFGTIHAAMFSFSRPIGTTTLEPAGVEPVNFDPNMSDLKTWIAGSGSALVRPARQVEYPTVNRRLKGDRMPVPQTETAPASSGTESAPSSPPINAPATQPAPVSSPAPVLGPRPKSVERLDAVPAALDAPIEAFGTLPTDGPHSDDVAGSVAPNARVPMTALPSVHDEARDADVDDDGALADKPPEIPAAGESDQLDPARSPFALLSFLEEDPAQRNSQLYFSGGVMGARSGLESWPLGAEPVLVPRPRDPDIKLSALEAPPESDAGGETVADRDDASRLMSPAERLGLEGKPRAKAEKCLADAVYFEARGEPLRGQMAVAQVVMNRVFSGYYPNNVCGVVYQNANRHLACQFTFACEGKDLSRIDETDMWEQAKRIAKDMLDGKIWLTEVGHATHYHAYWVHPSWVHEMNKMYRLGVHTFYRPRAWGDGSDAPIWGAVPALPKPAGAGTPQGPEAAKEPSKEPNKEPAATVRSPQAAVSPEAGTPKSAPIAKL